MSKSLEALEKIETTFVYNKQRKKNCYAHLMHQSKVIEEYYKDYNTIKQDLERLAQLEKENQELKEPKYKVLMGCRGGGKQFAQLVEILKKENQELKLEKKILNGMYRDVRDTASFYMSKCEKLEKTIDILKNKLHIEFDDKYNEINFEVFGSTEIDYVYFSLDDKQEYELLKEMLK